MQLHFNPIWPWVVVAIVGAGLVVFSHWSYRRGVPARRLLLFFRDLSIAIALFAILRPSLVFTKIQKQSSVLVVLADKSKSMMLRDMWDDKSRWDALRQVLVESDPSFEELAEDVQIRRFEFSRKLNETISLQAPDGDQTAIGDALQQILQRTAGERLAGIILLSDGTNTTGVSAATIGRQLGGQNVPVYAVGFGQEVAGDQVRDLAARAIVANPTVFAKNKMTVRGEFLTNGYANQSIPIRLLLDGVEKSRGVLKVGPEAQRGIIDLSAIPDRPGDVKVTVEAEPQDGELLPGNNSVSTFVTVMAGGISVLSVEGKYRYWEPKFMRWALDQSPDIELTQLFLLDKGGKKNELPPDLFTPGRYDVIILGDVNANQFDARSLASLADSVTRGTGLMMMGGYESFGPGGWQRSPLGDVLPAEMGPADGQLKQAQKMLPTPAGNRHFILRLAGDDAANRASWESLSSLDGASSWSGLKPGALLLAVSREGNPLLAAQDVGRGRSIAFAGDTTWRWRRGAEGVKAHARFWRQLILWLAHKDDASGSNIHVKLEHRRLALNQRLPFEVRVEDAKGNALSDAQVSAVVQTPDGKELPIELLRKDDQYRGSFWQTDAAGDYTVRVTATQGTDNLGTSNVRFLVYDEDLELRQLAADLESMRNLASVTSGQFMTAEEFPPFVAKLKGKDLNLEVSQPVYETLWDRWPLLVLFVVALVAEWVVRKRHGMA